MKEKIKKAIKRAYRKGRKEGFDHGVNVAKMLYEMLVVDLRRQLEALNSELILGEEEGEDE